MQGSEPDKPAGDACLQLPADLGIESAVNLRDQLLSHVYDPRPLSVDGSQIARLHTAALQLLLMFWNERRRGGLSTAWRAPNQMLVEAAAMLGLEQSLQLKGAVA
ncbi:STAS domain-containing protein [Solimonas aquatica]|uniref:STAS domain-containing protein n=1 Tax=Solimonas aquatica TaxID=489703 RepID=A0A1H9AST0_9GAMM|nr:STAS domain-containing protein [Solimonas aquatica]SEP79824.1 STAS domain-containing protein [Solimonas aquatica]